MALTTEQSSLPSTDEADKISSLVTSANLQYSLKNYDAASELYSRATELQAEKNGDMAPENADILYLYGRCLYKVALSKSNVLGATVAGPSEQKPKKKSKAEKGESSKSALPPANVPGPADADQKLAEDIVEAAVENKEGMKEDKDEKTADKPFFMITGDDNWDTDSDEEEQGEEGEGEDEGDQEEGEDDDFATAYEILEVARVLLQRQIEGVSSEATNGSAAEDVATAEGRGKAPAVQPISEAGSTTDKSRAIKERLADTHDLLAEISLENERFVDAIPDSRASLALKKELHPPDSSLLAEAHFKLSLALEFASVTKLREAAEKQQEKQQEELRQKLQSGGVGEALATLAGGSGQEAISGDVDEGLREEAAVEMELAIASSKLRVEKEEAALRSKDSPEDKKKLEADIADVKEMIDEMEQRVCTRTSHRNIFPHLPFTTQLTLHAAR